ncbi:MAG: hypothetical protein LBQ60_11900 [Bacteroidales bacterium]|jgi:outer membrane protein assembly factor BamB|nr:hypothetical protein [Bacteroidales bacterium]
MFFLKEKYKNGNAYLSDAIYMRASKNYLCKKNKKFETEWEIVNNNIFDIKSISDNILVGSFSELAYIKERRYYKNQMYLMHKNTGEIFGNEIPFEFLYGENNTIYCLERTENCMIFTKGQLMDNKYIIEQKTNLPFMGFWELIGDNFFYIPFDIMVQNQIIAIDIHTGEENWHFHTSKLGKGDQPVKIIYGVYQEILVVNIGKWHIVGINTQTGKIEWNIDLGYLGLVPNSTNDILYSLISSRYTGGHFLEINPCTGEMVKYGIEKSKVLLASQRKDFILVGTHIITTDDRDGKIGAFNILTHEFDWIWEEEGTSFYGQMKYFDPYLFVQNKDNTLYVFEKEKNN